MKKADLPPNLLISCTRISVRRREEKRAGSPPTAGGNLVQENPLASWSPDLPTSCKRVSVRRRQEIGR